MRLFQSILAVAAVAAVVWAAVGLPSSAPGQTADAGGFESTEIETDRDSFTFATTTAGAQRSILESSYSFIDNRKGLEAHSVPELLVRHGIGDRVELRVGFNYEAGGSGTVFPTGS